MKTYIPLLFVLLTTSSCATNSLEELMVEAKECVTNTHSVSVQGVVGDPTSEQKTACWASYNEKIEIVYERSERKRAEKEADEYYMRQCYPGVPVFESWGGRDKRFKGCWERY